MATAKSMTQDDANVFSELVESDGYITEHVEVWNFNTHEMRQIVLRTPAEGFDQDTPSIWEVYTDEDDWLRIVEPRRRFDSLFSRDDDDEDDDDY